MGDIQQHQKACRYRPAWASHMSELSLVLEGTDEVIPSVTYQRKKKYTALNPNSHFIPRSSRRVLLIAICRTYGLEYIPSSGTSKLQALSH